jgi:hypothetical protein
MINQEWVQHRSGVHTMFPSTVGNTLITSYAVHRPDGNWSLMLVNRDQTHPHAVKVVFENASGKTYFAGPVADVTFGSEQYVWIDDGPNSHADPDHAPVGRAVNGGSQTVFVLPEASITVLRGKVAGLP